MICCFSCSCIPCSLPGNARRSSCAPRGSSRKLLAAPSLARKGRGQPERSLWAWQYCAGCMVLRQPWTPPPWMRWSGQPFFTQGQHGSQHMWEQLSQPRRAGMRLGVYEWRAIRRRNLISIYTGSQAKEEIAISQQDEALGQRKAPGKRKGSQLCDIAPTTRRQSGRYNGRRSSLPHSLRPPQQLQGPQREEVFRRKEHPLHPRRRPIQGLLRLLHSERIIAACFLGIRH